jgi:hypothetical protein
MPTNTETTRNSTAAGRFDMYAAVHKGLRALMASVLTKVGRTSIRRTWWKAAQVCASLLNVCRDHAYHEVGRSYW